MMTGKQKAFADILIANPTLPKKEAIKRVYNVTSERASEVMASENLRKPAIMEYLRDHAQEAETTLHEVMQYSKEQGKEQPAYAAVAVSAAKDVLDRVHGKATQRTENVSVSLNFGMDLSGQLPDQQ
jgi:hypothetical protein